MDVDPFATDVRTGRHVRQHRAVRVSEGPGFLAVVLVAREIDRVVHADDAACLDGRVGRLGVRRAVVAASQGRVVQVVDVVVPVPEALDAAFGVVEVFPIAIS